MIHHLQCWPVLNGIPDHPWALDQLRTRIRRQPCAFGSIRDGGARKTIGTTIPCMGADTIVSPVDGYVVTRFFWEAGVIMLLLAGPRVFVGLAMPAGGVDAPTGSSVTSGSQIGQGMGGTHHLQIILFDRPEGLADGDFLTRASAPRFFLWTDERPAGLLDPTADLARLLGVP